MVCEFISSIYHTQQSSNIQNFKPAQTQLQISIAKGLHDTQYQIAAINTLTIKNRNTLQLHDTPQEQVKN